MLHKHLCSSVSNSCIFMITTKFQNQFKKRDVTILSIHSLTHIRLIKLCLDKFSIESRLIKFHESKSLIKPVKLTQIEIPTLLAKVHKGSLQFIENKNPPHAFRVSLSTFSIHHNLEDIKGMFGNYFFFLFSIFKNNFLFLN